MAIHPSSRVYHDPVGSGGSRIGRCGVSGLRTVPQRDDAVVNLWPLLLWLVTFLIILHLDISHAPRDTSTDRRLVPLSAWRPPSSRLCIGVFEETSAWHSENTAYFSSLRSGLVQGRAMMCPDFGLTFPPRGFLSGLGVA